MYMNEIRIGVYVKIQELARRLKIGLYYFYQPFRVQGLPVQ